MFRKARALLQSEKICEIMISSVKNRNFLDFISIKSSGKFRNKSTRLPYLFNIRWHISPIYKAKFKY